MILASLLQVWPPPRRCKHVAVEEGDAQSCQSGPAKGRLMQMETSGSIIAICLRPHTDHTRVAQHGMRFDALGLQLRALGRKVRQPCSPWRSAIKTSQPLPNAAAQRRSPSPRQSG